MRLLEILRNFRKEGRKGLAVLLDPDKTGSSGLPETIKKLDALKPDFFFAGGSLITGNSFHILIEAIRRNSKVPVVLFCGDGPPIQFWPNCRRMLTLKDRAKAVKG